MGDREVRMSPLGYVFRLAVAVMFGIGVAQGDWLLCAFAGASMMSGFVIVIQWKARSEGHAAARRGYP